jgi:hypothetical protein
MKNRNRWIMVFAIVITVAAIAADHIRHRPPYLSETTENGFGEETEAPCTMGLSHTDEDEDDEL